MQKIVLVLKEMSEKLFQKSEERGKDDSDETEIDSIGWQGRDKRERNIKRERE